MSAFWIILAGSLTAACCALVGCFLVLRRMAMLGDAISHAVLPGIALAFLISGGRAVVPTLIGAGALGIFTAFLAETLHKRGRLQEDASIGVVFTWLFAVGVILINLFASDVHLDQDAVLYGEIAYTPLDTWLVAGRNFGPRAVWVLGSVLLLNGALVGLAYKELKISTFDPALAAALGIQTALWHYLLMGAVSLTTVAAFESVGAILVVAMLIVPPATAYLLTERLGTMLWLSVLLGVGCAVGGYVLASWIDGSIAGAMAVVAGIEFGLALLFSPSSGLVVKRWRQRRTLTDPTAVATAEPG